MWVLMAVRSTMRVAVCAGSVLMSLMLAILVMLIIAFVFVFVFVRHYWLSRFFLLRLRQASASGSPDHPEHSCPTAQKIAASRRCKPLELLTKNALECFN